MKEQYKKRYRLLKKEGIYFRVMYNEEEKNDLLLIIKNFGFRIISANKNESDPMELQHG